MKKLVFMFVAIAAISFASCGQKNQSAAPETDTAAVDTAAVDTAAADTAAAKVAGAATKAAEVVKDAAKEAKK